MRSTSKYIITGVFLLSAVALLSLRQPDTTRMRVQQQLVRQADSLLMTIKALQATPQDAAHGRALQQRFRKVRLAYKRIEWATEYFDPLTTRQINGPPVPETELNGQVIQPDGLQVIEQDIFPVLDAARKQELKSLLNRLMLNAEALQEGFQKANLQDWQILDAAKLEVFRLETLGLNDFDAPLLKNCFNESAAALQSVQVVVMNYGQIEAFVPAIRYLQHAVAFDRFDRAAFITQYANPLTRTLNAFRLRQKLPDVRYNRLLNQNAATLFDSNAFNCNAYTAAPADSATPAKIALGKKLFFDPVLSGSGNRSCASCHQQDKAFTDGLVKNRDITGKKMIARNTPTLINASLQPAQFYDLRSPSLEDQASDVMQNKDEMHGDMQVATSKLWRDSSYRRLFSKAYPVKYRTAIDTFEVMNALASYIRSLAAMNSHFDRYMRGNTTALNRAEVSGFNLFMGKAKCSTCHYLPLFNGALPPRYMQMEAEVIGVPKAKNSRQPDPDPGLYGLQPRGFNRYAFKTTTVRNAALTAPYMHNGVFKTLEEVIDFYNKGGGAGLGMKLPNQTLDARPLKLTKTEKNELIAFIKSLDNSNNP